MRLRTTVATTQRDVRICTMHTPLACPRHAFRAFRALGKVQITKYAVYLRRYAGKHLDLPPPLSALTFHHLLQPKSAAPVQHLAPLHTNRLSSPDSNTPRESAEPGRGITTLPIETCQSNSVSPMGVWVVIRLSLVGPGGNWRLCRGSIGAVPAEADHEIPRAHSVGVGDPTDET